ncbi:hypothetical protein Pint_06032 [Pistacia integerrima]|uniref:Uncharacterized protein n=1 Tax=Pistacia integerrima TaxID=434235 RepID=A0ACC0Z765_9ROSI|nr:hypothetical protein Pint_06032 [Pistacia integerrima]
MFKDKDTRLSGKHLREGWTCVISVKVPNPEFEGQTKDKDTRLSGKHLREGLTCVISVKVPNPEFEGQTKTRLGNPEVQKVVFLSVKEYLIEFLKFHPDVLG